MIFVPYSDESDVINMIKKVRNENFALIRLTDTMVGKNNIDVNGDFAGLLLESGIVDFLELDNGGNNGIVCNAIFVHSGASDVVKIKFYKVANERGDRRFSIETLKRKVQDRLLNVGDLVYFSIFKDRYGVTQIFFVDLTHNVPTEQELIDAIGIDPINELFAQIKPRIRDIISAGYHNNSKGAGAIAPKDVGDTLESLLDIGTNNRENADYGGLIELKAKGGSRTLDTLFTLRPCFEGTSIAVYEPNDRNRVAAFARYYGYESEKHPNCKSLYITIGSKEAPQNTKGFFLDVVDDDRKVCLKHVDNNKVEVAAFWNYDELQKQLELKHPSTLWFKAKSRNCGDMVQFKYTEVEFTRTPQFTTFLTLIKSGKITYDWRGYTSISGKYSGKNHGNAWRIKPEYKKELFGESEKVEFNE